MMHGRARMRPMLPLAAFALCSVLAACSREDAAGDDQGTATTAPADMKVPVSVAGVRSENLDINITVPGRTEALGRDRIRAPYAARLASLHVTDGDHVTRGELIAVIVSKDSEAALVGARQMLATATSAKDKADAQRAVEVAQASLVEQSLKVPTDGVVLSHGAEAGDYVDAGEVLVTVADTATVCFNADVPQSEVGKVAPGQRASIDMPALGEKPVSAVVQGLLPMASSANFSAPVRLDFVPPRQDVPLGLFGTAHIVVAHRDGAIVVPARAVLRDDVTGVTRLAIVQSSGAAHWLSVDTGVRQGGQVEIVRPAIAPGTRVITEGQVGLPEGAKVVVE